MRSIEEALDALANWVAEQASDDGIWRLGTESFYSLSQTTMALAVLRRGNCRDSELLKKASVWLYETLEADKNGYTRTLAWPLFALPASDDSEKKVRRELTARLIAGQGSDGGWGHGGDPGEESDAFPTALAVLALAAQPPEIEDEAPVGEPVRLGVGWLNTWLGKPERKIRLGTWAMALLAVHQGNTHVACPRRMAALADELALGAEKERPLDAETIRNGARHQDAPYRLPIAPWVLVALSRLRPVPSLLTQLRLANDIVSSVGPHGVSQGQQATPSYVYSAFHAYYALDMFREGHGESSLLNSLVNNPAELEEMVMQQRQTPPRVFVGSTVEGLPVARRLRECFDHDEIDVVLWEDGTFTPSMTTIENLEHVAQEVDFAVLLATPDDLVDSRGELKPAIRDNVVFEAGMFVGSIGRRRVFIVRPRVEVKWPTDWLGVTPVDYDQERFEREPKSAMRSAASRIRDVVESLGRLSQKLQR